MQALSIAAAGMSAAASRLNASAQRVAAADVQEAKTRDEVDYGKERIDQISAVQDFKANAVVARTADQMTGALLDIKA
jgi:flagellar basal body rod protein FlgC